MDASSLATLMVVLAGPPELPRDEGSSAREPGDSTEDPPNADGAEAPVGAASETEPGVDIWDESTWTELSPEEKEKLRAKRARLRAGASEAPPVEPDEPPPPRVMDPNPEPPARIRDPRLEEYWEAKHSKLKTATITFAVLWGVGSVVAAGTGASFRSGYSGGKAGGVGVAGVVAAVGFVGTMISASMLGALNNAKPLYFNGTADGFALRF